MSTFTRTDIHRINIHSFDIIKFANSREKNLVYGYIRKYDILFNINNIPELLNIICLWYFVCFDELITVDTFEDMNLNNNLLRGIYASGWEKPSTLQQRSIIPLIRYQDALVQAQSGTGKTATFGIAALQLLDLNESECQTLILSPSRELAISTRHLIRRLGVYLNITSASIVGGTAVRDDINILSKGVQIVTGTPGRVNDMICRGVFKLNALKLLIIDEADEAFSRGFKEQIYDICAYLKSNVQIGVFSATIPHQVTEFVAKYLIKPVNILVKQCELTLHGIKQFYINVEKEDYKLPTLFDLYESLTITQCVIFVNTEQKAVWLNDKMKENDFTSCCVYDNMENETIENIFKEFRSGIKRVLITTDLMERGIDLHTMKYSVSLVINYDIPINREHYIYRVGRSGKYGRKSTVINFVINDNETQLRNIETFYNTQIEELPMDIESILM